MRAAIDIGSNSVRLAMTDGTVRSEITKLADGLESSGRLSPSGIQATAAALARFAAAAKGCESIKVFATEAVRKASDGKAFCELIRRTVGLDIEVLSPEQEAMLALKGAVKPAGEVSVCDLGGGSMELISSADGVSPNYIKSLPLGVVVLKNKFNGDFRAAIDSAPALVSGFGETKKYPLVMIGGSACAIAAAALDLPVYDKNAVNGTAITAAQLDAMLPMLMSKHLAALRPVCAKRADTLPYGAIIIQALLNHMGAASFTVSDSGNLTAALM